MLANYVDLPTGHRSCCFRRLDIINYKQCHSFLPTRPLTPLAPQPSASGTGEPLQCLAKSLHLTEGNEKETMDERNLEAEIDRLAIAAKALKLAVEQANRLLWTDRERAERILMQALKRAEEDGI